jgi:PKD repeat protein
LAACTFYAAIWKKSPIGLPFTAGLAPNLALYLQTKADEVVFGQLNHWNLAPQPFSGNFSYTLNNAQATFADSTVGATHWIWNFGDGSTDSTQNPVHTYTQAGNYVVTLIVGNGCQTDTLQDTLQITLPVNIAGITPGHSPKVYPSPAQTTLQWPIPSGKGNFLILDSQGKAILIGSWESGSTTIAHLPNGVYYFRFIAEDQSSTTQIFTIQH